MSAAAADEDDVAMRQPGSALEAARALRQELPVALKRTYGDAEGAAWWDKHQELFEAARQEYGQRRGDVYSLRPPPSHEGQGDKAALANSPWLQEGARRALSAGTPAALRSVLLEVCQDSAGLAVYQLDLFTHDFCDILLAELDYMEASGIPMRRPNGMNRFGAILSQLGYQEGLLEPLLRDVLRPFALELWPSWVGQHDCEEAYGFTVRYRMGEDVDLLEHTDTSNVTLNVCLSEDFEGGDLYFKGVRFTETKDEAEERPVAHRKGAAVLHLGGHTHGARPITSGERSNLVLWGTGQFGKVRIAPLSQRQLF